MRPEEVEQILSRSRELVAQARPSEAAALLDAALQDTDGHASDRMVDLLLASAGAHSLAGAAPTLLIERYRRAIDLLERIPTSNIARLAGAHHQLAMALHDMGAIDASLADWVRAAELARAVEGNDRQRSWILLGLTPLLVDSGRFTEALPLAEEALQLRDPLRERPEQRILDRTVLARALIGTSQPDAARQLLSQGIDEWNRTKGTPSALLAEAERLLATLKGTESS